VYLEFTKKDGAGRWPDVIPPGWEGSIQYDLWLAFQIAGVWHAGSLMHFWRSNQDGSDVVNGGDITAPRQIADNWLYAAEFGPLHHYQPQPGEIVGAFVTAGATRFDVPVNSIKERSNIVVFPFPSRPQRFDFGKVPSIPSGPSVPDVPPAPPVDLTPILARLDAIEQRLKTLEQKTDQGGAAIDADLDLT
jgi:hypothetical protein